jgi:hypothetical protein
MLYMMKVLFVAVLILGLEVAIELLCNNTEQRMRSFCTQSVLLLPPAAGFHRQANVCIIADPLLELEL